MRTMLIYYLNYLLLTKNGSETKLWGLENLTCPRGDYNRAPNPHFEPPKRD
jgi:hypothetical protein